MLEIQNYFQPYIFQGKAKAFAVNKSIFLPSLLGAVSNCMGGAKVYLLILIVNCFYKQCL